MKKIFIKTALISFLTLSFLTFYTQAANTPQPAFAIPAKISIAFDDGLESVYTFAAPAMSDYGFVGTAYVYTKAQNQKYSGFMNWSQVSALQNIYGWEVGSHAYSHRDLTTLSSSNVRSELSRSKNDFLAHGISAESFASPFGAYNDTVIDIASDFYNSHRTAWDLSNTWPINNYELRAKVVSPTTPVVQVKSWIDEAKANSQWLILYFHALTTGTPELDNDDYNINDFKEILDYIKDQDISVVKITEALESWGTGPNLVSNGSFESGRNPNADDWTRLENRGIRIISNSRGVYPAIKRSAELTGGQNQRSISTNGITVDESKNYRLTAFFRISDYRKGDASVWISEFDSSYSYLGGQWLGGFFSNFIGTRYFDYKPTPGTKIIEIFFLTHTNSLMKFELDGVQLKEAPLF